MSLPTVAIAGATGRLGVYITEAFLSPEYRPKFKEVIVLSRNKSSKTAPWEQQGATVRTYSESNIKESLEGVDILVNSIGSAGHHMKDVILSALADSSVKVYFPSEFGVNHTVHDFSQPEWDYKKAHAARARELLGPKGGKVCCIYPGLFLESSIGPWFGFDTKNGKYECVGSKDKKIGFTGMKDLGLVTASLASLSAEKVVGEVHVAGDNRSFEEIAEIMEKAGAGPIEVTELDLQEYKKKVLSDPKGANPAVCLRFLMGERKIEHTKDGLGDDDEFVNPGERNWKWKTVEDLAKETKGKPNT